MKLSELTKPLAFFDLEGTSLDVSTAKIVSIAIVKMEVEGVAVMRSGFTRTINPGIPIPPESTEVHGITDEQVAGLPMFDRHAAAIHDLLKGCDLGGYNLRNYDVPLLYEELSRCGITWDLKGVNIIDVGTLFKKKEERTLSAAVKFYCGKEMVDAHDALADTVATIEVFDGQRARYPDIAAMTVGELSKFTQYDERVDLAGKIVMDKDGDPSYAIGKSRGVKVKDDTSFAYWMLGRDFTSETKATLRRILDEIEKAEGGRVF